MLLFIKYIAVFLIIKEIKLRALCLIIYQHFTKEIIPCLNLLKWRQMQVALVYIFNAYICAFITKFIIFEKQRLSNNFIANVDKIIGDPHLLCRLHRDAMASICKVVDILSVFVTTVSRDHKRRYPGVIFSQYDCWLCRSSFALL